MSLADTLKEDMKAALRGGDKIRLGIIRMALAAIQQREVDSRAKLDDAGVMTVIEKMIKQGRDALSQYEEGGRSELAEKEAAEIEILQTYLPEALADEEIDAIIAAAIEATGAAGIKDMGKVMSAVKAQAQGRADMSAVAGRVRSALGAG